MALLDILRLPDPRLRRVCTPVVRIDEGIRELAADMLETMYAAPGRGLAAPQVGITLRLFVVDTTWKEGTPNPRVFVNPVILDTSDTMATRTEGCLSIPGVPCDVTRPEEITLQWTDLDGAILTERLRGIDAVCVQHEFDHLNGRLCIDLVDEWDRAEISEQLLEMETP